MKKLEAEIAIKPMSINQAWQGRRFKTGLYKKYEEAVLWQLPKRKKVSGNVAVYLTFSLKRASNCDVDNFIKPLLDIMVKKGYIDDDRYIFFLQVQKEKAKEDNIKIEVVQL